MMVILSHLETLSYDIFMVVPSYYDDQDMANMTLNNTSWS